MNADLRAWYRGKRIFVTGHTGFKGCWLTAWLRNVGAHVTGFAFAPEQGSLFAAIGGSVGINSIVGDVRDYAAVQRAMVEARPEVVFHMAAQAIVRRSYLDPVGTFSTNVMGTVHVLQSLRRIDSVRAIVVIASDKCYNQDVKPHPFREEDPLGGDDPYSSSKAAGELATSALSRSFFNGAAAVASARAGNVIGGGDWAEDRLIPDLMRAAEKDVPALIRSPDATRPWQYVLDPLRGYLMLGRSLAENGRALAGPWNFGPSPTDELSVREVVEYVSGTWKRVRARYVPDPSAPHEAASLSLNSTKARQGLGWTPLLSVREALDVTACWYRDSFENTAEPDELVQDNLRRYEENADLTERMV